MPAARGSGADIVGDISPQAPRSPKELACQVGAGRDPCFPAACSSLPPPKPNSFSPLPSCRTGLALPMAQPPRPSYVEKLCSPTQSPCWPACKVKGTSQSISSHSLALTVLALGPNGRKGQFGDGWAVPTGMRKVLGHRKGQAALSRRMALVQDRALMEAQRKIKQAEKTLGNFLSVSTAAQRTAREAEQVSGQSTKVRAEGCGMRGACTRVQGTARLAAVTGRAQPVAGRAAELPNTASAAHPAQPTLVCVQTRGMHPTRAPA